MKINSLKVQVSLGIVLAIVMTSIPIILIYYNTTTYNTTTSSEPVQYVSCRGNDLVPKDDYDKGNFYLETVEGEKVTVYSDLGYLKGYQFSNIEVMNSDGHTVYQWVEKRPPKKSDPLILTVKNCTDALELVNHLAQTRTYM